jgi:hypothetical protein
MEQDWPSSDRDYSFNKALITAALINIQNLMWRTTNYIFSVASNSLVFNQLQSIGREKGI